MPLCLSLLALRTHIINNVTKPLTSLMDFSSALAASSSAAWRWFTDLPSTLWVGLVTGGVALGGVVLTNRRNRDNLYIQHENERLRRQEDVLLQTRRDIYTDAALVVEEAVGALFNLTNPLLSDSQATSAYDAVSAKMGRIYVVADEEAATAAAEYMRVLNNALKRLRIERRPLLENRHALQRFEVNRDRAFELLKAAHQALLSDRENPALQAELQRRELNLKREMDSVLEAIEREKLLQKDMFLKAEEHHSLLNQKLVPLLAAVRAELNAPPLGEAFYQAADLDQKWTEEDLNRWMNLPLPGTPPSETRSVN